MKSTTILSKHNELLMPTIVCDMVGMVIGKLYDNVSTVSFAIDGGVTESKYPDITNVGMSDDKGSRKLSEISPRTHRLHALYSFPVVEQL